MENQETQNWMDEKFVEERELDVSKLITTSKVLAIKGLLQGMEEFEGPSAENIKANTKALGAKLLPMVMGGSGGCL